MVANLICFLIMVMTGQANFQLAEKLQSAQHLAQIADQIDYETPARFLQHAKMAYIAGSVGRVVLIGMSLKYPAICKGYLGYDQCMILIDFCMLQMLEVEVQSRLALLVTILNFICLYHHFWVSVLVVAINQVIMVTVR